MVHRLSWDGKVLRTTPKENLGLLKNGHFVNFGTENPWSSIFEDDFRDSDNQFPDLLDWIAGLDSKAVTKTSASFDERMMAHHLPADRRAQLGECLASLIVRSPGFRNRTKIIAEYDQNGIEAPDDNAALIASNVQRCFSSFSRIVSRCGKFAVLLSDAPEFIFGDGFLHTFGATADMPGSVRGVIPLLPYVSVLFARPGHSYRSRPELVTLRLRKDEVAHLNEIVCIYSRDYVFYRSEKPTPPDHFADRTHYECVYHETEWLRDLIDSLAWFTGVSLRESLRDE